MTPVFPYQDALDLRVCMRFHHYLVSRNGNYTNSYTNSSVVLDLPFQFSFAVRRNLKRFPEDLMFECNFSEFEVLRSQFVTANKEAIPILSIFQNIVVARIF